MAARLLRASKLTPQVKAASPATQTTCSSPPSMSRAAAMPTARGKGGSGVTGAVTIVLAFRPEEKAVQALVLPDGRKAFTPAGEKLMDVTLMADVEDEFVLRGVEYPVKRNGQLDDSQVRSQVAAGLGENADQFHAHFFGQARQLFLFDCLHVLGAVNGRKKRFRIHRQLEESPPAWFGRRHFWR